MHYLRISEYDSNLTLSFLARGANMVKEVLILRQYNLCKVPFIETVPLTAAEASCHLATQNRALFCWFIVL
jgi:hypothetical protein